MPRKTTLLLLALGLGAAILGSLEAPGARFPGAGLGPSRAQAQTTDDGPTPPARTTRRLYWWNLPPEERPALSGGEFRDRRDSLGFAPYRALNGEEQLERRHEAEKWIRQGRERASARFAQHDYATAVGLCPYIPEAWQLYAQTQLDLGRYRSALAFADGTERSLRFAASDRERDELSASMHHLRAVARYNLGDVAGSLESATAALALDEGDFEVGLLQARAQIDLELYEDARTTLDGFGFGHPAYAQAQAVRGLAEMKAGELDRADAAFREAHEYGMRGGIFENDRGRLRLAQGRPEDAIGHFETAVESLPRLMEARNNLAVAYRRMGRDDKAEEILLAALVVNRDYGPACFNLAEIHRARMDAPDNENPDQSGRDALFYYAEAIKRGYEVPMMLQRRAGIELRFGDVEAAEQDLLRIAGAPDTSGRVLYLLARAKKDQQELRVAERLYRMALERGFGEAPLHSDLGEVLLRRSDFVEARQHLETALALDSSLVATRINLSVALAHLGDLDAAERALSGAEERAPGDDRVAEQRRALQQLRGGG